MGVEVARRAEVVGFVLVIAIGDCKARIAEWRGKREILDGRAKRLLTESQDGPRPRLTRLVSQELLAVSCAPQTESLGKKNDSKAQSDA